MSIELQYWVNGILENSKQGPDRQSIFLDTSIGRLWGRTYTEAWLAQTNVVLVAHVIGKTSEERIESPKDDAPSQCIFCYEEPPEKLIAKYVL